MEPRKGSENREKRERISSGRRGRSPAKECFISTEGGQDVLGEGPAKEKGKGTWAKKTFNS